ncbi:class I adenylate-forming enzyme family protein [Paraburkholderia caribensis]|uniref:class I adenylate-forming enzyme family protein n=1 Tax=Paraburkholderia caribensis TaxID=75105 RepID=UPI00078C5734|nr:AMP-binding protein [Paraburkholderia caribensis]AMV45858.1 AMP-dependent synthetase [Paraburkholderia caribensis]
MEAHAETIYRPYVDALVNELKTRAYEPVIRYQGKDVTRGELRSAIYRYARALGALGIGRGAVVALHAPNRPDALAVRYAANLLGAATMFMPALARAESRAVLLARIRPTLLVVFPETAHLVRDAVDQRIVSVGYESPWVHLDRFASVQSDQPLESRAVPHELGVIVSSGGTTGVPKASRRSFAAYSAMVMSARNGKRRQLINGPLAYLSQVLVDTTLIGGGSVVLEREYSARATLAAIESERITDVFLVEPQLFAMMDHPDVGRRDLSSLRCIAHVGGSAPAALRQRAARRLGPVLAHMYGASEAGLVSVLPPPDYATNPARLDSAGRIRPGVDVRLRCADGTLAANGRAGSIEVRSAAVARGYRNQAVESAQKFKDGWCLTGDIGLIDDAGYLHVMGRSSDVAQIDQRIIGPVHIEDVLCRLPDVRYAVAFAANTQGGEHAWNAVVEPWAGQRVDVARCTHALKAAFGELVANAVRLSGTEAIPLTEQGKVDRIAIERTLFVQAHAGMDKPSFRTRRPISERLGAR